MDEDDDWDFAAIDEIEARALAARTAAFPDLEDLLADAASCPTGFSPVQPSKQPSVAGDQHMRCAYREEQQISIDLGGTVAEQGFAVGDDTVYRSDIVDDFCPSRLSEQDGKSPQVDTYIVAQQTCAMESVAPPKEAKCSSVAQPRSILTEYNRVVSAQDHLNRKQQPRGSGLEESLGARQALVNEKRSSPCPSNARHVEVSKAPSLSRHLWSLPSSPTIEEDELTAIANALKHNALLSVSAGLDLLSLTAIVAYNFIRWFPKGKVAVVSKHRSLLTAQLWEKRLPMLADRMDPHLVASFAAPGKPEWRKELWNEPGTQLYLVSPATLFSDIRKGICDYSSLVCVVLMEAEQAVAGSDSAKAVQLLQNRRIDCRTLAISSVLALLGPGTVQEIVNGLGLHAICHPSPLVMKTIRNDDDGCIPGQSHLVCYKHVVVEPCSLSNWLVKDILEVLRPFLRQMANLQVIPSEWVGKTETLQVTALDTAAQKLKKASHPGSAVAMEHARLLIALRDSLSAWGPEAARELLLQSMTESTTAHRLQRQNPSFNRICDTLTASEELRRGYMTAPKVTALTNSIEQALRQTGQPQVLVCVSNRGEILRLTDHLQIILENKARIGSWLPRPAAGNRSNSNNTTTQTAKQAKKALDDFGNGLLDVLLLPPEGQWPEGVHDGPQLERVVLVVLYDAWASLPQTVQILRQTRKDSPRDNSDERLVLRLSCAGAEAQHAEEIQRAAEQTEVTLMQGQATSYRFAHPGSSRPSPEHNVLSVSSLRYLDLKSETKAGWTICLPTEKRPTAEDVRRLSEKRPTAEDVRRLSRRSARPNWSGDQGQRRKSDQCCNNAVDEDHVRNENECEELRDCEPDMVDCWPASIPEQARENLLSERMLREQQKKNNTSQPGPTGDATSLLLPACLESRSGGALLRQPRLALRMNSNKKQTGGGPPQVNPEQHPRLVHASTNNAPHQQPSLSECSWDSEGDERVKSLPNGLPAAAERHDQPQSPQLATCCTPAVPSVETGAALRSSQHQDQVHLGGDSSYLAMTGEASAPNDGSPGASYHPKEPLRLRRQHQVIDSQTPPVMTSTKAMTTPHPPGGQSTTKHHDSTISSVYASGTMKRSNEHQRRLYKGGRTRKRDVRSSCLKPGSRPKLSTQAKRPKASGRSFLDDAAALSGSDSGDEDPEDDDAGSDLEGFLDTDGTPLQTAPHVLYQPSQATPMDQFANFLRRGQQRQVDDTPGAHDGTPDEYDLEDSFLVGSDEEIELEYTQTDSG